ncbi:MAG: hypothetical protein J6B28_09050, partial [Eubacterium sp.]|nr:hypothetical protein [Eubacterium sp.]
MGDKYEQEYMRQHDENVTRGIHKAAILSIVICPVLYLITKTGVFDIADWYIMAVLFFTVIAWLIVEILLRAKKLAVAKYIQLGLLTIMI